MATRLPATRALPFAAAGLLAAFVSKNVIAVPLTQGASVEVVGEKSILRHGYGTPQELLAACKDAVQGESYKYIRTYAGNVLCSVVTAGTAANGYAAFGYRFSHVGPVNTRNPKPITGALHYQTPSAGALVAPAAADIISELVFKPAPGSIVSEWAVLAVKNANGVGVVIPGVFDAVVANGVQASVRGSAAPVLTIRGDLFNLATDSFTFAPLSGRDLMPLVQPRPRVIATDFDEEQDGGIELPDVFDA